MSPASMGGARVLVVDDDPTNVQLLKKLLRNTGVEAVEGITNSSLVLDRVKHFEPDIVLLDLHMPPPDGFQLLDEIGAFSAAANIFLPVVIITADITEAVKERALAAGAADFLTKPFRVTETLLRVGNLVRTRRLHQSLLRNNIEITAELESYGISSREIAARRDRVVSLLDRVDDDLSIVFQPIVTLDTRETIGHEALSRFSATPARPPNEWFAEAAEAGLGVELEVAAIRDALDQLHLLASASFVAINASPDTITSASFAELTTAVPACRVVLELTEHEQIDDYAPIIDALARLRALGVRLSVDDTGAGFSSLSHILKLDPEFIKLDRKIVEGVDSDPARAALVGALVSFSRDTGSRLIAEGIETIGELDRLVDLGVELGQGYYLGRPAPLEVENAPPAARGSRVPVRAAGQDPAAA
jgi:EAL domain-containing protein (putative c-di-GMP-specific phosphodiesterase class I)